MTDIKTTSIFPEKCECGRMFITNRDKDGKMKCPLCYTGLTEEELKKLWGTPMPKEIRDIFG